MSDPRPSTSRPSGESELVEHIRSIDVQAPHSLHRRVESLVADSTRGARRGAESSGAPSFGMRPRLAAASAILAVLAAVVIAVGASGGGSPPPSLREASALTLRNATAAPPSESARDHAKLAADVDGVSFPYWGRHFGWHTAGARTDNLSGHTVTTVFYANSRGQRVGYAIVSGAPPAPPSGSAAITRTGTPYWTTSENGTHVVTWRRDGHLCVVSGRGVSSATLLRLASWDDHRALAS